MERNVTIKGKTIILFLLLTFPFFQIDYFVETISWAGKAYTLCQILAGIGILLLFLREKLFRKLPPLFYLFSALLLVMCLASAVNGGSIKRALEYAFGTLMIGLVIEYGIQKDLRHFLLSQMLFFGVLTAVNFLSVLIFRNGMFRYLDHYTDSWFLGFKSGHIVYQLAFLFSAVMYAVLCNKKKMYFAYIGVVITLLSSFLVKNRSAMLVLIPLLIMIFVPVILKFTKVMNILTYTGLGVIMNLLFVILRRQDLFEWLIVGIFHRKMNLTHRTDVWDSAFRAIREHPVIGHGYQDFVFSDEIITTHNELLEVLYKTGIIGLIIFLCILALVIWKLFRNRNIRAAQWTALFLGAFFLLFVMEQYAFSHFFYLLLFAFRGKDLGPLLEEQDRRRQTLPAPPSEKSRTEKSARNFLFTVFANVTAILVGLIAQKFFIRILGIEYAGLNGLFTNVITMLGIADLGIGEAVIFNLYKPLKENDRDTILSLMRFYRKAFHIIAGVIAVIGVCLIPALPYIARTSEADVNLTVIYLIFLADVVFSYFLSYKRAILYADQKNFYISMIHMGYLVCVNTAQLLMLYFTHDYYAYLLTKLAFRILENLIITAVANRQYPFLKAQKAAPLSADIRSDIKKKTGALVFHKIGSFVVTGTDNILISVFFNLSATGMYNNYYLVIDAATKLFNPAIAALTPSVGNMLVSDDKAHVYQIFRRIRFMNFWIAAFAATMLLNLVQPFISLWFGEKYILPLAVVVTLSFQFFQALMRGSYNSFQDAAGIFYENRFVPLFESVINLGASILLLHIFGLAGVFAGTIVSSLALWCFSYPKYVYTRLFGRSIRKYAGEMLGYLAVFLIICGISSAAVYYFNRIFSGVSIAMLIADAVLCAVICNILLALVFCRSDCFRYFLGFIRSKFAK